MKVPLYPFQEEGVREIERRGGRALLADEVGMGKSIQVLSYLERDRAARLPALIVCPGSLRVNWWREANSKADLPAVILSPKSTLTSIKKTGAECLEASGWAPHVGGSGIVIANYETLTKELDRLTGFRTLVLDEAHAVKDESSKRSEAALRMARACANVILLTGTPFMNRPRDVWHLGQVVKAGRGGWPSFWEFGQRYCGAYQQRIWVKENGVAKQRLIWNFDGASNLDELNGVLVRNCMIRRTKAEVGLQLPEKIRMTVPLAMGDSRAFDEAMKRLRTVVLERKRWKENTANLGAAEYEAEAARHAEKASRTSKLKTRERRENDSEHTILGEISEMRKQVALAKVPAAVEYIANLAKSDQVVVFAHHHEVINQLRAGLGKLDVLVDSIDGRDGPAVRQERIDRFQKGELCVLILGILAAGTGLTLTKSATSVFAELPWRPGDLEQATGRIHRIGQKRGVTEHILIAAGTIEEQIAKMLDAKREVTAVAAGNADLVASEESILEAVMNF